MSGLPEAGTAIQGDIPVAPAPEQGAPQSPQEFIQVPRGIFADDDFHAAKARLNTLDQLEQEGVVDKVRTLSAAGFTLDQIIEWAQQPVVPDPVGQAPPPPPYQAPEQQPQPETMTTDSVKETMKELLDTRDKERAEKDAETESARTLADARKAEVALRDDFVKSMAGDKPDGRSPKHNMARDMYMEALHEARAERIPSTVANEAEWKARFDEPLSEDQLASVADTAKKDWADVGLEAAASFAQEQTQVPAASLAGGPAGKVTQDGSTMSEADLKASVISHVEDIPAG